MLAVRNMGVPPVTVVSARFHPHQELPPLIRLAAQQAEYPLILIDHRNGSGEVQRASAMIRRALPMAHVLALGPSNHHGSADCAEHNSEISITLIDEGPFTLLHCPARGDLSARPAIDALASFVSAQQQAATGIAFLVASALPGAKTEALLEGLRTHGGDPQVQLLTCGTDGWITLDETVARGGFAVVAFSGPVAVPMATPFGGSHNGLAASGQAVFYRTIIEQFSDGVCLLDPTGVVLYENLAKVLPQGALSSTIRGQNLARLFDHNQDQQQLDETLATLIKQPDGQATMEARIRSGDGTERHFQLALRNCIRTPQIRAMVCSLKDITALKDVEKKLRSLVTTDDLTGVASRRHFLEKTQAEIARARRHRRPLSLLLLDLDYFKRINDQLGHAAGDMVLRAVGVACRQSLRREEIVGRLGGEEFAILLPETALSAALMVSERIRRALTLAAPSSVTDHLPVTASVGIAEYDLEHDSVETLLARADDGLYAAKRAGRNRSTFAPPCQVA